jgi:hypothetical protein
MIPVEDLEFPVDSVIRGAENYILQPTGFDGLRKPNDLVTVHLPLSAQARTQPDLTRSYAGLIGSIRKVFRKIIAAFPTQPHELELSRS